jgi:hypothetical protein
MMMALESKSIEKMIMRHKGVVFARDGVSMAVVHKNWEYCTISYNIKVLFSDVMSDNRLYVDTAFPL